MRGGQRWLTHPAEGREERKQRNSRSCPGGTRSSPGATSSQLRVPGVRAIWGFSSGDPNTCLVVRYTVSAEGLPGVPASCGCAGAWRGRTAHPHPNVHVPDYGVLDWASHVCIRPVSSNVLVNKWGHFEELPHDGRIKTRLSLGFAPVCYLVPQQQNDVTLLPHLLRQL